MCSSLLLNLPLTLKVVHLSPFFTAGTFIIYPEFKTFTCLNNPGNCIRNVSFKKKVLIGVAGLFRVPWGLEGRGCALAGFHTSVRVLCISSCAAANFSFSFIKNPLWKWSEERKGEPWQVDEWPGGPGSFEHLSWAGFWVCGRTSDQPGELNVGHIHGQIAEKNILESWGVLETKSAPVLFCPGK